jgi:hypothetical protein
MFNKSISNQQDFTNIQQTQKKTYENLKQSHLLNI